MAAKFADLLKAARRIVFLTGAGISTESGIPDFRSDEGLYSTGVAENVFDLHAFVDDPAPFYRFAQRFLPILERAEPNRAHKAIARLARTSGGEVTVVTQNIDLLHQQAGTPVVLPVHGTIETSTCIECGCKVRTETLYSEIAAGRIPRHQECGGVFKPDIVFFGELLPQDIFDRAQDAVRDADLIVVVGSSLVVHPAAGLPALRRADCRAAVINYSPTWLDEEADCVLRAPAGEVLDAAVGAVLDERNSGR